MDGLDYAYCLVLRGYCLPGDGYGDMGIFSARWPGAKGPAGYFNRPGRPVIYLSTRQWVYLPGLAWHTDDLAGVVFAGLSRFFGFGFSLLLVISRSHPQSGSKIC